MVVAGVHGAHPVSDRIGAAGATAAMGVPADLISGPLDAARGAVAGGLVEKAPSESKPPNNESAFWRANHASQPYLQAGVPYEDYEPAYRFGWESFDRRTAISDTFESVESALAAEWDRSAAVSSLTWERAREMVRAAWHRVETAQRSRVTLPH